jgi:CheY-like chemotaxis protein
MNSIHLPPDTVDWAGRILAIEPDDARAEMLRDMLTQHLPVEIDVVRATADAVDAISERVPDLVLTSVFLPPAEESVLVSLLRALPAASHTQIITVPYFVDAGLGSSRAGNATVLDFLRHRSPRLRPRCSPREVCSQIELYLQQSREARRGAAGISARPKEAAAPSVAKPDGAPVSYDSTLPAAGSAPSRGADRRRVKRRPGDELPSTWTVQIAGASCVEVIDISSRGVLIETRTKRARGSILDLEVLGQDMSVVVAARTVRSSVAAVDRLGVRYRIAAAFARELDLVELQPASLPTVVPRELGDVLRRVLTEAERGAAEAALHARFAYELRQIMPARQLHIRPMPVIVDRRTESIAFTVPNGSGTRTVLQVIFDSGHRPSPLEFRLARAAAGLAAIVLQVADPPRAER